MSHRYYGYETHELDRYRHVDDFRRNSIDFEESIVESEQYSNKMESADNAETDSIKSNKKGLITRLKIKRESIGPSYRYGRYYNRDERPLVNPPNTSDTFPYVRNDDDERPIQPMKDDFFETVEKLSIEEAKSENDEDEHQELKKPKPTPRRSSKKERENSVVEEQITEIAKRDSITRLTSPIKLPSIETKSKEILPKIPKIEAERILYPMPILYPIAVPPGFPFSFPQIQLPNNFFSAQPRAIESKVTELNDTEIKDDVANKSDEKRNQTPVGILKKDDSPKPKIKKKVRYEEPCNDLPYYTFTSGEPNLSSPKPYPWSSSSNESMNNSRFNSFGNYNGQSFNNPYATQMPQGMFNSTYQNNPYLYTPGFNQPTYFF